MKPTKFCNLTKPQWELLVEIVDGTRKHAASYYPPQVTLEVLGLIRVISTIWSDTLIATDEGRKLVAEVQQKMKDSQ